MEEKRMVARATGIVSGGKWCGLSVRESQNAD
jgi:hypothetical protein